MSERRGQVEMGRLLVLDDDAAIGKTIGFIAEGAGFEVYAVSQPDAFLEALERWDPTHIALDLVMPEMDGVEVVRLLAARRCRAALIITSGVGGRVLDAARRSAVEHGLNVAGVLAKPFFPEAVRALLKKETGPGAFNASTGRPAATLQPAVLEEDLRRGLKAAEFLLAYQPKIFCATGGLAGFEALARWEHPRRGTLMPDSFVPLAETTGLVDALTDQVLTRSLHWLSEFPAPEVSLAVNLSPRSLADLHLADRIAELCGARHVDPSRLILEVTETATMRDPAVALDLLTRLRMKRFQISIDDFGTGYSSMLQLVRLPFSEMKVDKSFVMAASRSTEARTVIKSVVELGHSLGLKVCAEGVEDAATLDFLQDIGCDLAQGFFISRPLSADQAADWCGGRDLERWSGSGGAARQAGD